MSLDYEDDGRSMSSETRQLVEDEVRKLVQVGVGYLLGGVGSGCRFVGCCCCWLVERC